MIENNAYKIIKLGDYSYSLISKGGYKSHLYSSILKSLLLTSAFEDHRTNSIFFTAETVQTLTEYLLSKNKKMTERECAKLIYNLTSQIKYLEENKYVLYGYNLDDILVIDEDIFIVANSNYILPLNVENNTITFYSPNNKPFFINKELITLTKLPSSIHYKSSYYSLGVLVTFCLTNKNILENGLCINDINIETILRPIYYSKIYWFLKRCLNKNYDQRVLLFI